MGFIGHTRFSLLNPDSPAWLASNGSRFKTAEDYREHLYSSERLDVRCQIFLEASLPQLKQASEGYDYKHVVSYSADLPLAYQSKLEQAARDYEFLILDCHSSKGGSRPLFHVANEMFGPGGHPDLAAKPFGWFRLDDDDLLSVDFFRQMDGYISDANVGMQVSFGTGVTALFEDGDIYNPRSAHHPLLAIGLLNICRYDGNGALQRPVEASHNRSDRFNPVILDSRRISYLWLRHVGQDTTLAGEESDRDAVVARTLQDMARFPRVDSLEAVETAFPVLAGKFNVSPSPGMCLLGSAPSKTALDEKGFRVATGSVAGLLQVELALDSAVGTVPGNALLGLELVDLAGTPITGDTMAQELRAQGLTFSSVPGIGHFRYLNTRAGTLDYSVSINLPPGVRCVSILLRRWNNPALSIDSLRLDVFGASGTSSKSATGARVFVYGSCISRDPFELETEMQLVDYRSRSSLGSAFAARPADWEAQINIASVTSPFQRRMVAADVAKTLAEDLREADFDALVLDFIDERMSTVEVGGSVVTDSPELEATGFVADPDRKREPWTDDGWRLRKAGIAALLEVVAPSRIIVNRAYWATKDNAGLEFAQAAWIAKNNAFLRELYAVFEAVPGVRFIDYPERLLLADPEHRWGRQPYHYVPAFNAHFLRELKLTLERN
ncbi:DUF6270 domain-containing protein [Arthrobacter sp. YAF17]|uniref:DUF6270 domain-containing protein n=1 Tax=Arthrobacter sp. YAF17 TaxID=3233077 RepID=UPI003F8E057D